MSRNDLSSYFGTDYKNNPGELKSLNGSQKLAFSKIVEKCENSGISNKYAIAAILGVVSKESNFIAKIEDSYSKTSANRIRDIFGKSRTSKYTNEELDTIKKSDKEFFDLAYGPIALNNGSETYGNTEIGDGFRYRGRGFNQITFKNIYKENGDNIGVDLVSNPELLEQLDVAASTLINYFITGFKTLLNSTNKNNISRSFGFELKNSALNTINSLPGIESSVKIFYSINSGLGNYKNVIKYEDGSYRDSSGYFVFPNDNLSGYTKARNRTPYFYQILTGNALPNTPPIDNITDSNTTDQSTTDVTPQDSYFDNDIDVDTVPKNSDFTPNQLTQFFKPTIKPQPIILDSGESSKKQRKEFLTGMGTSPVIYYNGIHIEYSDVQYFELYHEGILPAIKITFSDRNGIFKDTGFPTDDAIISIFIYSRSKRIRSINMDFKISNFKDLGTNQFAVTGISNIPKIYLRKFKSYSKKTSFESLQDISKECDLGFCSNISNTKDKMTWINTGFPNYQFVNNIVKNSYLSDESFMNCYIDFYYNICYVDLEKELSRDNSNDKMIISNGLNEFTSDPEQDEDISDLILSTDNSVKNTNAYIEKYTVTNRSTQISLNKAYFTKTKFYDSVSKELLIFDVDSITSEGDKTIILKGKPGEEEFFKYNVSNIWMGKLDKFEEDGSGNAHSNFNYSMIQNDINMNELSKISIEIFLPSPNYNLYIFQKVYLALINQKPGINHTSLKYKRLTGNWMIVDISIIFDGSNKQKISLIKRELELEENERNQTKETTSTNIENSGQTNDEPNEISPNDTIF